MKKILIICTTGMGDTLFGAPALRALRKSFPGAVLDVLVHRKSSDLLRFNPHINGLYEYRENPAVKLALAFRLRKKSYGHVLIFHANSRALSLLNRLRYGEALTHQKMEDPRRNIRKPAMEKGLHSIVRRLRLVEEIGGKPDGTGMELYFGKEHQRMAEDFLSAHFSLKSTKPLVGVQIGAAEKIRRWPIENFAEIIIRIQEQYGADVFISGGKMDRPLYRRLGRAIDLSKVPMIDRLNLLGGAALISRCGLFISNDTGPLHMAVALGVPTLSLYCPSFPDTTGPIDRDEKNLVIQKKVPCDICLDRECEDPFCMASISVDEVFEGVKKILGP